MTYIINLLCKKQIDSWLRAVQTTSHYLNQLWSVNWLIYVSLVLNELISKKITL